MPVSNTGWTRRGVLAGMVGAGMGSAGAALIAPVPLRAAGPTPILLEAKASGLAQLLDPPGPKTAIWGYDGNVPGPVLKVKQGEEIFVRFKNSLPGPSSVHWHGIRIANAMDGAVPLTQGPVQPGATFDYRFVCPDAGSYWYHPHVHEFEQLARGLAGALIVEEKQPIKVDQDLVLLIKDYRIEADGTLAESFGTLFDKAHAGRLGNVITVNGAHEGIFAVKSGERVRARLINASNSRVLKLNIPRVSPKIIAVDGQPVSPRELYAGGVDLPPGGRIDLVIDMMEAPGGSLELLEVTRDPIRIAVFAHHPSERARAEPLVAPIVLASNPVQEPKVGPDALYVPLVMTGGAMSPIKGAMVHGQHVAMRELITQHGLVWAFNGVADMAHGEPLFRVARGRTVVINIDNDTRWPHAMHTHGHHVRVLKRSGREIDPYLWDTILMDPGEKADVAFVADNPGKWVIHCHMIEHMLSGMMAWFEVT
ncbi:MAG: multicopper oxidase family protein [Hyphomicrobiaceae bacterium]|nr:MAG: multicopper oxidase family protein [Hyphomicrobiaceae bacterium]